MKLDLATLPTVPDVPPGAGPDRAFDPAPPDPRCPLVLRPATAGAADADDGLPRPTNSPVTEPTIAAATMRPRRIFASDRHALGRRVNDSESSGCVSRGAGDG